MNMKPQTLALAAILSVTLVGCGTTTASRTGTGAAAGAATGALIGSMSGHAGEGALIGAGVGAVGGYLYDQNEKRQDYHYRRRYY